MSLNNIKWANIIPLIGGMTLGNRQAIGKDPQFFLSYDDFFKNEKWLKRYFHYIPHYELAKNKGICSLRDSIDMISTICPCAGLSMLNPHKGGPGGRGPEAIQNRWLFSTSEMVLRDIQPKVFWGENGYNLFTKYGRDVVKGLYEIAQKYGYSFSMISTASYLHGLPQKRKRCFYFFWKGSSAPLMNYYNNRADSLRSFLENTETNEALSSRYFHRYDRPSQDPYVKFIMNHLGHKSYLQYTEETQGYAAISYLFKWDLVDKCIHHLNDLEATDRLKYYRDKKKKGGNFWDPSPYTPSHYINAVTSRTMRTAIHPDEDRFLNMGEYSALMGMPSDFSIAPVSDGDFQLLTQNVPVQVAGDWTQEVLKFINGKHQDSGYGFLKQDNIEMEIVETGDNRNALF